MNTTYTLIKNPDGNFFLHGERCDSVLTKHWVFLEDGNSYTLIGATFGQEYGYPTLTFDEVVAREIGYVDMLKKCNEIYDMHPNNIEVYGNSESKNTYQAGVWDGYLQAIEDNKDKVYTKDDFLLFALSLFGHIQRNPKSVTENIKEFVINYTLPTKWQVQITNNSDNSITVNKIV